MRTFALMQAIAITRLMMRIRSQEIAANTDIYFNMGKPSREVLTPLLRRSGPVPWATVV